MNRSHALFELAPVVPASRTASRVFRHDARDAWLCLATALQAFATAMSIPLVLATGARGAPFAAIYFAVSIWWCSNVVAHVHLHTPIFKRRALNVAFSLALGVLVGVPQTLWRARHLAHHAESGTSRPSAKRLVLGPRGWAEAALIVGSWAALLAFAPKFLLMAYAPGFGLGMLLCSLQGRFEHAGERVAGQGVSYYGRLYNLLWLNDGYHAEHHARAGEHWARLPLRRVVGAAVSDVPPLLRPFESSAFAKTDSLLVARVLCALERLALSSPWLQKAMVSCHARAFKKLLGKGPGAHITRVVIVGGGLFPRSILALRGRLPNAKLTVLDASPDSLDRARAYLAARGEPELDLTLQCERFVPGASIDADLVVVPLALVGDRDALYGAPPAAMTVVHDWLWNRRGDASAVISLFLMKRMNLILAKGAS